MSVGFAPVSWPLGTRSAPLKRDVWQPGGVAGKSSAALSAVSFADTVSQGTAHQTHLHGVFLHLGMDVESFFSSFRVPLTLDFQLSSGTVRHGWVSPPFAQGRFVAE